MESGAYIRGISYQVFFWHYSMHIESGGSDLHPKYAWKFNTPDNSNKCIHYIYTYLVNAVAACCHSHWLAEAMLAISYCQINIQMKEFYKLDIHFGNFAQTFSPNASIACSIISLHQSPRPHVPFMKVQTWLRDFWMHTYICMCATRCGNSWTSHSWSSFL